MTVKEHLVELRELEDDELLTKLREAKEELFNLRFQSATGQLDSHGRLNAVRKNIARIYTIMRERELGIGTVVAPRSVDAPPTDETASSDESASEKV
jgi:large subunit ribosomal protein L29